MTDNGGGFGGLARTFVLCGLLAVLIAVGLVMVSGRSPGGEVASSKGGARIESPWNRSTPS